MKIFSLVFFINSMALLADEVWTHYGLRPLGMGNAFVAVSDDFNALFYNPAGLSQIPTWRVDVFNPRMEISTDTLKLMKQIQNQSTSSTNDFSNSSEAVLSLFEEQSGVHHSLLAGLTPHVITPWGGMGLGFQNQFSWTTHRDVSLDLYMKSEILVPVSWSSRWMQDRLRIGLSVKPVFSLGWEDTLGLEMLGDPSFRFQDQVEKGTGLGVDCGVLISPRPDGLKWGLMISDFGGTPLKGSSGSGGMMRPSRVHTGFSWQPWKTNFQNLTLAVDIQNMNRPVHFGHKLKMGVEWALYDLLKIQTGLNDGLFCGGMEIDVGLIKWRMTSYAMDHGPVIGLAKGLVERRVAMQVKVLL